MPRRGVPRSGTALALGLVLALALALGRAEAWAEPCTAPTPACHLENGTELLTSDPRRAADELLASYQLDERTDTLALYATALALDRRYALALDTWKRVIVFRDSELEAARAAVRRATGRKRAVAGAAAARAQKQSEQAAAAIIGLWPHVGRVRIRLAPGSSIAVSRDGAAVDPAEDVTVNAGGDALVFTHRDGSVERVAVQVAPGAFVKIDAPAEAGVRPAAPPAVARAQTLAAPAPPKQASALKPGTPADPAAASARPGEPGDATAPVAARSAAPVATAGASTGPGKTSTNPSPNPGGPVTRITGSTDRRNPLDGPVESAPSRARASGDDTAATPAPALVATRTSDEPKLFTMSRVGLGLVAGAVVAGGVAGSFGYLAGRDFDRARTAGCSSDGRCPLGPAADLAAQSNHRARIAQISAVGAAALAVTGVTLWLVGRGKDHRTVTDVALRVGPMSTSGVSTALSGRF